MSYHFLFQLILRKFVCKREPFTPNVGAVISCNRHCTMMGYGLYQQSFQSKDSPICNPPRACQHGGSFLAGNLSSRAWEFVWKGSTPYKWTISLRFQPCPAAHMQILQKRDFSSWQLHFFNAPSLRHMLPFFFPFSFHFVSDRGKTWRYFCFPLLSCNISVNCFASAPAPLPLTFTTSASSQPSSTASRRTLPASSSWLPAEGRWNRWGGQSRGAGEREKRGVGFRLLAGWVLTSMGKVCLFQYIGFVSSCVSPVLLYWNRSTVMESKL